MSDRSLASRQYASYKDMTVGTDTMSAVRVSVAEGSISVGTILAEIDIKLSNVASYGNVAVTTGTSLVAGANVGREKGITLFNLGANNVYVGTSPAVGTSNGFALPPLYSAKFENYLPCYVIGNGTSSLRYWEE